MAVRSILFSLVLVTLAACGGRMTLRREAAASGEPATVDGVTAGLDDGYFNDAEDGDFRGRAENVIDADVAQALSLAPGAYVPPAERLRIRRGWIQLRTASPEEVGPKARALVEAAGGWMESQADLQYVFRVPAAQFDAVLAGIEALGAVASRRVTAEDVTDRVRDLELRIRNARALRDRYAALAAKADKVEDLLAIERELAKLTETIERLEGEQKGLERDIAWSRLEVVLEPAGTGPSRASKSPFRWLSRIGVERVPDYQPSRTRSSRLRWELPAGFADMGRTDDDSVLGWAYAPEGVRVVVREFDHDPRVDQEFWRKELRRELEEVRGYVPVPGQPPDLLVYDQTRDGKPIRYVLRLVLDRNDITVVEVIGPTAEVERAWGDLARVLDGIAERRG